MRFPLRDEHTHNFTLSVDGVEVHVEDFRCLEVEHVCACAMEVKAIRQKKLEIVLDEDEN